MLLTSCVFSVRDYKEPKERFFIKEKFVEKDGNGIVHFRYVIDNDLNPFDGYLYYRTNEDFSVGTRLYLVSEEMYFNNLIK